MLAEIIKNSERVINFSTKAETLFNLLPLLKTAKCLPTFFFTISAWRKNKDGIFAELKKDNWFYQNLVVRSSAIGEDSYESSLAGQYESIINVQGEENLVTAVEKVISSFNSDNMNHQVLIQPYLSDVKISGVAFTRDPNTDGPYVIINYDDYTGDTTTVTSGISNHKCYIQHYKSPTTVPTFIDKIVNLISELKHLFNTNYLDIEFAINKHQELYLFQARPLISQVKSPISLNAHEIALARVATRISMAMKQHPYLHGKQTVYGVMPDWNPAEIIGIRPKPLALSLYRELVTNDIWAYQRDNYGYSNLRSFPLLIDFEGLPYIDVRVSFNSFLPKGLSDDLAERLVNYYLDRLIAKPSLHDKVEFDIVFSCYTLDLQKRLKILSDYGFDDHDKTAIYQSLIKLTNQILHNQKGLWKKDLEKVNELCNRQKQLFQSDLDSISKMYWILEDCKRYGTLPFAGLARASFIAVQILKSFISEDILNEEEYARFLYSINSISSMMNNDFQTMTKQNFLEKYGHLRPGTYDVLSLRYDEAPNLYFNWENKNVIHNQENLSSFSLTITQLRKIQEHLDKDGLQINVLELLEFIKCSIESREYSKFVFSRSISEFLKISAEFASQYDISREECAYIDLNTIISLYSSSIDPADALHKSIAIGKKRHQMASAITLPPLITSASQVWAFELPDTLPNFITQKNAIGKIAFPDIQKDSIANTIVMIPSADPGYDWIFSHNIVGFITKFGGVNSHMAIRASELGIPAIIGVGEIKFNLWAQAGKLHIDCLNKKVNIL